MPPVNGTEDLSNLIPEIWSKDIYDELRNSVAFLNIFNRDYEGEIKEKGDTVKVNTILAPTGEILTDDKQTFSSEEMQVTQQSVVADRIAVAAFEFTSMAQLQSLSFEKDAKEALQYAVRLQMENQIVAALLPSESSPDHTIAPAASSDLAAVDVAKMRTLFSVAKVPKKDRYLALDPNYYGDLIQKQQIASRDYNSTSRSTQTGEIQDLLYGFNTLEHDLLSSDIGFAVHRSALTLVAQTGVTLKISDLHPQKKLGFLLSCHIVFGFKLMDNKRIIKISG